MSKNRNDTIDNNLLITGDLTFASDSTVTLPNSTITNAMVNSGAAIAASKQQHHHNKTYGQSGAIAAVTIAVHEVHGATATIKAFSAGSVAAATASNACTVDLKKNGTTCLNAVITLDSGNTAYVSESAVLSVTSCVDGDVLTVVVTNTATWNGTGLFAALLIDEDYATT